MDDKKIEKSNIEMKVFLGISIGLFILLTVFIFLGVTDSIDQALLSYVISIRSDFLTKFFTIITNIGSAYTLMAISVLILLIKKNKKKAFLITINLALVFITSQVFKVLIRRDRPALVFLVNATGYSYPSGHMMVSSAFYFYILYLLCRKINNKIVRGVLFILTFGLIILIGFSRMYLGVHYLTDIIGAILLSVVYLIVFITYTKRISEV